MTATELPTRDHVAQNARTKNIVLVVPPFQSLARPSMGVSQLKANLAEQGFATHAVYLNLRFAERIGVLVYDWIAEKGFEAMLGDIVFANARLGHSDADLDAYFDEVVAGTDEEEFLRSIDRNTAPKAALHKLARQATAFAAEEAVQLIMEHDPWLVGFSSSFQQNLPSLAVMRHIKQQHPEIVTALGGANTQDEMGQELFDRFEEIDFVGRGQCDITFVDLVHALRDGKDGTGMRGFLARGGPTTEVSEPLVQKDLDALPIPNFDEYFADMAASPMRGDIRTALVAETARGCWWGAKSHCTFCGLNGARHELPQQVARPRLVRNANAWSINHGDPADRDRRQHSRAWATSRLVLPELGNANPLASCSSRPRANLSREQVEATGRSPCHLDPTRHREPQ